MRSSLKATSYLLTRAIRPRPGLGRFSLQLSIYSTVCTSGYRTGQIFSPTYRSCTSGPEPHTQYGMCSTYYPNAAVFASVTIAFRQESHPPPLLLLNALVTGTHDLSRRQSAYSPSVQPCVVRDGVVRVWAGVRLFLTPTEMKWWMGILLTRLAWEPIGTNLVWSSLTLLRRPSFYRVADHIFGSSDVPRYFVRNVVTRGGNPVSKDVYSPHAPFGTQRKSLHRSGIAAPEDLKLSAER